ncbi:MAG: zf-TFIIB domain-containing protein [Bacteroidetes bacterium]|nr:zf-TFIIB domain-containing protein [Bacteroidota bacterium]MBX7044969.1 zf-TFIIB domain-containing protein [Ignavibacteria bacterium]
MNCPVCNEQLLLSEKQGIEIDYCPKCRGIWLDRGELEKIVERSNQISTSVQPEIRGSKSYDDDDYHYRYKDKDYKYKKKKGFLGDLFDFD